MDAKLTIHRASWTLIDQGVVSFGNFLLNVLLARTLVEEEYGEFALFLGAIFILRNVDYSFISYPLSVRLCNASDGERARLLGNTILLATALALVLGVASRTVSFYALFLLFLTGPVERLVDRVRAG